MAHYVVLNYKNEGPTSANSRLEDILGFLGSKITRVVSANLLLAREVAVGRRQRALQPLELKNKSKVFVSLTAMKIHVPALMVLPGRCHLDRSSHHMIQINKKIIKILSPMPYQ